MYLSAQQLHPPGDPTDEGGGTPASPAGFRAGADDLPYKVEVWDATGAFVEQVVAVSFSSSIGYAAYYAATREFPGRVITLRHKDRVMSRWSGHAH